MNGFIYTTINIALRCYLWNNLYSVDGTITVHFGTIKRCFKRTLLPYSLIFIYMKTTIILTLRQADMLLSNLPQGHKIKMSVATADKIVDSGKPKKK